jgi:hypothetical protein
MDDPPAEKKWLGAATPVYLTLMKILGVVAVISTSIIEIHSRKLLDEVQLSEPVAGFVYYLSFASVSLLVGGAVLRTMFWQTSVEENLAKGAGVVRVSGKTGHGTAGRSSGSFGDRPRSAMMYPTDGHARKSESPA